MPDKSEKNCLNCGQPVADPASAALCPSCGLTYWKCSECGFTFTAPKPQDICNECGAKESFINVTCYTPECGGPGHIDPRL